MRKDKLLSIILDLPPNMREQLAGEIYQSLDSTDPGLNADWIVEANHRMQQLEDIPPPMPEGESSHKETEESPEAHGDNQTETLFELLDNLRLHCTIQARTKSSTEGEGIPGEQVFRELKERSEQREELLGNLEAPSGPVPDVVGVRSLDDFKIQLTFKNGEQRIFDVTPYRKGLFSGLQDPDYFSWVKVRWGGIRWPNGEHLGAKVLYHNSLLIDE